VLVSSTFFLFVFFRLPSDLCLSSYVGLLSFVVYLLLLLVLSLPELLFFLRYVFRYSFFFVIPLGVILRIALLLYSFLALASLFVRCYFFFILSFVVLLSS